MCELCAEGASCHGCGRMICYDFDFVDDLCAPAYVTSGGDMYCSVCGAEDDVESEEWEEGEDYDGFEPG